MVRFLSHSEIDKVKWDSCIQGSSQEILYAYSFYLDIACPNWAALVKDDYSAVMPLPIRKKWGQSYVYTPYFIQQLGIFSSHPIYVNEFLIAIPRSIRLIEYNLNWKNTDEHLFTIQWATHHLYLRPSYTELSAGYDRTLKNNIKKAIQANLKIEQNGSIEEVIQLFYSLRGRNLSKISDSDYKRLENLGRRCIQKEQGSCWVVKENDQVLAGSLFVWSGTHYIFLFSGNSIRGKEVGALPFLLDYFIQQKAGNEGIFDFEGSNDPNLARFYQSFGSKKVMYPRLEINRLPYPLSWLKKKTFKS